MVGLVVFRACTSQTRRWITGVLFWMFALPQCLHVLSSMCWALLMPIVLFGSFNLLVMIFKG